ncbi:hypothetical protein [Roseibium salinum]|uniref:Uncharacterized protein n=1 Tax=Roseibium salinum TaxID=1604349 RepID=A0ABT3R924_9HYPH|nr:hypothetical protein [Roseibium sp. DSM 29163]MCX2725672.1 hypothetical protein [Roseibium sp. DSM 29163]
MDHDVTALDFDLNFVVAKKMILAELCVTKQVVSRAFARNGDYSHRFVAVASGAEPLKAPPDQSGSMGNSNKTRAAGRFACIRSRFSGLGMAHRPQKQRNRDRERH